MTNVHAASTLHLVFDSPAGGALADALRAATCDDAVLLLQDGVYAVATGNAALPLLGGACERGVTLHALDTDLRARGITARLAAGVMVVDDEGFVALTERHARTVSWF